MALHTYIPDAFMSDDQTFDRINALPHDQNPIRGYFGQLITSLADDQTHLSFAPVIRVDDSLWFHLARSNPHTVVITQAQLHFICMGEQGYVSPLWMFNKGVPTWNYSVMTLSGVCHKVSDADHQHQLLQQLTQVFEHKDAATGASAWSMQSAPSHDIERLVNYIDFFEMKINASHCKAKLSQNRPAAEVESLVQHLILQAPALAQAVARANTDKLATDALSDALVDVSSM